MDEPDDGAHVRPPTIEDVARLCRALNNRSARYILIGGFAIIAHGGGRTTKDIDFLIDPSPANVARVKSALAILADNAAAEIDVTDVETYTVVRVADEVMVDLLGEACGVTWEMAFGDAESIEIEDVVVPLASKRTLIRTKQTIRPSDAMDCDFLERLIAEEQSS